jgi:hypothetical protein
MLRHSAILLSAFLLVSCAATPEVKSGAIAWDSFGRNPNRPIHRKRTTVRTAQPANDPNIQREKTLATLRPFSKAWWVVHDEIELEYDRRTSAKLIICRGCFERNPMQDQTDVTGAIR